MPKCSGAPKAPVASAFLCLFHTRAAPDRHARIRVTVSVTQWEALSQARIRQGPCIYMQVTCQSARILRQGRRRSRAGPRFVNLLAGSGIGRLLLHTGRIGLISQEA
jgi:hypothetical protein